MTVIGRAPADVLAMVRLGEHVGTANLVASAEAVRTSDAPTLRPPFDREVSFEEGAPRAGLPPLAGIGLVLFLVIAVLALLVR